MEPTTVVLGLFAAGAAVHAMARYARTRAENLHKHPLRKRILGLVEKSPGLSISDICEGTGRRWGTVKHHLHLLEAADLLKGVRRGRERNYFPPRTARGERERLALLRQDRASELAQAVLEEPGVVQRSLTRNLGVTRKVLRHHVERLKQAGLLEEVREAGTCRYFPTKALEEALPATTGPGGALEGSPRRNA
jgi:predicted transcriptional regulator